MAPSSPTSGSGSGDTAFSPEQLLAHAPFVRALARALVRDDAAADDLAQESLLAALQKPPRQGSVRAWLVGVVRNLAKQTHRGDERRLAREAALAFDKPPPPSTPRESAERLELFGRLVAAVQRLDEPYRATIVRRFFDGASAQEIASEQSAPLETVRTRIKRGLERLRAELDASSGGRAAWSALLAPWVALPVKVAATAAAATSSTLIGAVVVTTKTKLLLTAAAVLFATTTVVLWPRLHGDDARAADATAHAAPKAAASGAAAAPPAPADAINSSGAPKLEAERNAESSTPPTTDPLATWIVRGVVRGGNRDGHEQPRPRAHVRAKLWEGYEQHGAPRLDLLLVSDELGKFEWPLRPPTKVVVVSVCAEEPNSYEYPDERLVLTGEPAPQDFDLPCYPFDATISGVVFGPDGAPAPDAQVSVIRKTVACDEHGEFTVAAPRFNELQVVAWAPGCAEAMVEATNVKGSDATFPRIEVHLKPGLRVRGHVRDVEGRAIAGATVTWFFQRGAKVVSDESGAYTLEHLPASEGKQQLFARADGFCQSKGEVAAGTEGTLDFVLRRGVTVSGTVLAPDGKPARGATVVLGRSRFDYEKLEARTHDDGEFTITGATPGGTSLLVEWRGAAPFAQPVQIPADKGELSGLVLHLQATHFLAGRVKNQAGAPIERVNVSFQTRDGAASSHGVTDATGHFRIDNLPAGPLAVRVYTDGYGWLDAQNVAVDRDDFEATLAPCGKAAGRVVDDATGEPITHFRIRFVTPKLAPGEQQTMRYSSSWSESGRTFDDADGTFETGAEMMTSGSVLGLEASAEGYAPCVADHVVLETDPDPDALEIRLHRGGALEGIVVDERDGRPLAGAIVKLVTDATPLNSYQDSYAATRPVARTDDGGRFRLDKVPTGGCRLLVECQDFARAVDGPIDVPRAGSPAPRTIRLGAGGAVEGAALTADGRPIANTTVRLYSNWSERSPESNYVLTLQTDASGHFAFAHLPAGRVQISLELMDGNFIVQAITRFAQIETGKTQELRLAPSGHATLRGRLHAAALPARTFVVDLIPVGAAAESGDPRSSLATFAHDGVFEISGVDAGKFRVVGHSAGFSGDEQWSGTLEIDVADGAALDVTVEVARSR